MSSVQQAKKPGQASEVSAALESIRQEEAQDMAHEAQTILKTRGAGQVKPPKEPDAELQEELKNLRETIKNLDSLSQQGLGQIASIAWLALISLETPKGHQSISCIAGALRAIWEKAHEVDDCIQFHAGEAGCGYLDESFLKRTEASVQAFRQKEELRA